MTLQKIDHPATFASTCKTSVTIGSHGAGSQIDGAIRLASAERPGPVHVDFPLDVAPAELVDQGGSPLDAAI
jgi:acetolactate synthase-1/2/3 large subunit